MIERKNIDDIFFRNASIAVMKYLEEYLFLEQVENGKIVTYPVPVFYNKSQDSQFMRDYFTNYSTSCHNVEYVDGDFDREPFAIVTLDSIAVKTGSMTNKFVRGNHIVTEYDENDLPIKKGASSVLYVLPLSLKYSVSIRTDDTVQSFRILQGIFEGVFKNDVVNFSFRDQKIRANMSLDASFTHDKKIDFGFNDDQKQAIKFNIDLECYYPVFDKTTTIFRGNVIRNFRNFIQEKGSGTLAKSTVTADNDKKMKVYENSTRLITREEINQYREEGYDVVYSSDITYESKNKYSEMIGPWIIENKELYLVKIKEESDEQI